MRRRRTGRDCYTLRSSATVEHSKREVFTFGLDLGSPGVIVKATAG
jgi:hypothetical protein